MCVMCHYFLILSFVNRSVDDGSKVEGRLLFFVRALVKKPQLPHFFARPACKFASVRIQKRFYHSVRFEFPLNGKRFESVQILIPSNCTLVYGERRFRFKSLAACIQFLLTTGEMLLNIEKREIRSRSYIKNHTFLQRN